MKMKIGLIILIKNTGNMSVFLGQKEGKEVWWNGTIDQWNTANKQVPAARDKVKKK